MLANRTVCLQKNRSWITWIFFVLFALSGASALIYEVVWVRLFTTILGASSYAVTIVLATFMAGLGLGAWGIGKKADQYTEKQLIKAYVILELGIGIYALLLPVLLGAAESWYVAFFRHFSPGPSVFNGFRLILSILLLIVPTTLIGATLPVLSRYIIRREQLISLKVSQLYALNTLGALCGTLFAGYILLPRLGISLTTMTAVGMNMFVAGVFWLTNAMTGPSQKPLDRFLVKGTQEDRKTTHFQKVVLMGFCLSGVAAMFYEVAWTRTLSMILGTSTYAFTTMLSTFLLGIALGSAVYGYIKRFVPVRWLFIGLQFIITASALMSIPLFEKLPFLYLSINAAGMDSWMDVQFIRFVLAASVMLLPTLALGTLLPVVSAFFVEKTSHLGRRLGTAYGLNTLGNVIGAAAGGLLLIPFLGMQKTIMIGAVINFVAGSMVCLINTDISKRTRWAGVTTAALLTIVLITAVTPWAPKIINSGVYVYEDRYNTMLDRYQKASENQNSIPTLPPWQVFEMAMKQYDLLYYDTGVSATVAVMERSDGVKFLTINGKTDASTGKKSDMATQVMIAQLPLLFHENPDKVLVVGLGSGITAGSVLTHDIRMVDCAELSPSVIKAARFFNKANHGALDDKRLRIVPRDARNMLLTTEERYDVIISQPSNPWISGESSLFSLEWYKLVRQHLESGGLFLQWLPAYLMSEKDLKIIVHTLRSVLPNLTVWTSGSLGDLIFIAKKSRPLRIDYQQVLQKLEKKSVYEDIQRLGIDPLTIPFELFVMNEPQLNRYLYSNIEKPLHKNTDDLLFTEFSTPKQLTRQKKVRRFILPGRLHGDLESLKSILININDKEIFNLFPKDIGKET